MASTIYTVSHVGLKSQLIEVEADVSNHLPTFVLVGLPDTAVQEARERIRSALENSDMPFPRTKVTVNLAPAHIRKEGSFYDLAIALSIICAQRAITLAEEDRRAVFIGELSLDGTVRPVPGVLLAASFAKELGLTRLYVAQANAREASYMRGVSVYPVVNIRQLVAHLRGGRRIDPVTRSVTVKSRRSSTPVDLAEIHGQAAAKRALEIAAAGGHNILFDGTPGSGKTMLAKALPSLLPAMTEAEQIEVSKIYSCVGLLNAQEPILTERPFRSPHHAASATSVIGGGAWPRPGEITLAHRGVLFLDELPEFPRNVLEALRQPLEDHRVWISRAASAVTYPAHFIFVGAANPCPCGFWGDSERACICAEHQRMRYRRKLSGPFLDRIDLHVRVSPVKRDTLLSNGSHESSATVRKRVEEARQIQTSRFNREPAHRFGTVNSDMTNGEVKKFCNLDTGVHALLIEAAEAFHLSARGMYKVLKVSRTIADLAQRDSIQREDVLEAMQYRRVDI